jgi:hypothetical protein
MENLVQQQTRIDLQKKGNEQGKLGSFEGIVTSVSGASDTMGMSFGPALDRQMPIQHPFIGTTSWIRSIPDINTRFLMQNRMDSVQPEALKTLPFTAFANGPDGKPVGRATDYQSQRNLYRQLNPGEHDIAASGAALAYFGERGNLDLRSGAHVKRQLNRESNSTEDTAPTHVRRFLQNAPGTMGDEERMGIVKRWTTAIDETYPQANGKFQSEHYLQVLNPANANPKILLRRIEGHVYEDDASVINHFTTAIPLRSQELWYTTQDNVVRREIDQNGNMLLALPTDATIGYEFLIPSGTYRAEIGVNRDITIKKDEIVQVGGDIQYTVGGHVNYDVTGDFTISNGAVGSQNTFFMDVTSGSEAVNLFNPKQYGFSATNAGGGMTSVLGPKGSSITMDSQGFIHLKDGEGGSIDIEGPMINIATSGPTSLSLDATGGTLEGLQFMANVEMIFLGQGAAIPAVLGLQLMAWMDAHTHISNIPGLPTSPPVIPSATLIGTPASPYSITAFFSPNI